jgi:uncharacterized phage protein gp47/JayE
MAFGVTEDGFQIKRLADIKIEIENTVRSIFGSGVNLEARTPLGQLIGIFAERESLIWELSETVYNGYWPQNAEGVGLDNALSLVGLQRLPATPSTVNLTFFGDEGTVIPSGSQVSRSDDSTIVFETQQTATIPVGSGTNEVQKLTFSAVPDAGDFALEFDGQITALLGFGDNAAAVESALEALSNIGAGNVSVSGDFSTGFDITFQGALAQQNVVSITIDSNSLTLTLTPITITPTTTTPGVLPNVSTLALSTANGEIPAPSGLLTVLETAAPTGFDSVTNPLDATLGDELESDADAKIRRNNSVANPGNATLEAIKAKLLQVENVAAVRMFENTSVITDTEGRPAKSYEAVVQGGLDADIAQVMFDTKPAGIQQVGAVTVNIFDSEGFAQEQRFSRPTGVEIYLEVDLTTDASFPVDGLQQAEDALLAYGNALNIADDVVVFTKLVCSLDSIPGILDVEIRIGVADIPASGTETVQSFTNTFSELTANFAAPHGLIVGNQVTFENVGGSLPAGLNAADVFWIVDVPSATSFKVSDTRGGDPLPFFDGGTGTNTVIFGGRDDNILIGDAERALFDSSRIAVAQI